MHTNFIYLNYKNPNKYSLRHPKIEIETRLTDAHCYLMKRSVIDILIDQPFVVIVIVISDFAKQRYHSIYMK